MLLYASCFRSLLTHDTNIKHAFQALALDEHGEAFSPTLWHLPETTWGQWANHAIASAASTVMHPLTRPKGLNTKRYEVGWGTGAIVDSYTPMYHVNGSKFRTPGTYARAVGYDMPGSTNEEIHPTVGYRYKMFKKLAFFKDPTKKLDEHNKLMYHPAGVSVKREFNRAQNGDGRWVYEFPNNVVLRGHKIKPHGFGRLAMAHPDSMWRDANGKLWTRETTYKYMRRLDIQNGEDMKNEMPLSDEGSGDEDWDLIS